MDTAQSVVTVGGLALSAFIAWYFWFSPREITRVQVTGGLQEVDIVVRGGYSPDVIVVEAGKPVRLNFTRQESAVCSERVIFDELGKSAYLPEGQTVPVEFTPEKPGEYDFHCQMNMLRGKLIVE
ncbi:MAG: cupredoxin domain-containing protein [Chloroflexota bacterium]